MCLHEGYRLQGCKECQKSRDLSWDFPPTGDADKLALNTKSQPKPQGPLGDILQDPPPPSMRLVGYNTHRTEQV